METEALILCAELNSISECRAHVLWRRKLLFRRFKGLVYSHVKEFQGCNPIDTLRAMTPLNTVAESGRGRVNLLSQPESSEGPLLAKSHRQHLIAIWPKIKLGKRARPWWGFH